MQDIIFSQVKKVLSETMSHVDTDVIQPESKLKEELGLDSMSSLTFLMALEDNIKGFYVDPQTLEMDHMASVGAITEYVKNQIARNRSA